MTAGRKAHDAYFCSVYLPPAGLLPDRFNGLLRILQGTDRWLRDGGRVMMEIAFDQKEAALEMASQFPKLSDVKVIHDYSGNPRILLATKGTAE